MFIKHRFKLAASIKKLIRPLPMLSVALVFLLGLAGNAAASEASLDTTHTEQNNKQLFFVSNFPKLGINQIYIPADPAWWFDTHHKIQIDKLTMQAQANDGMAALIELAKHKTPVSIEQLPDVTNGIVNSLNAQLSTAFTPLKPSSHPLQPTSFQAITHNDGNVIQHQIDIFLHNQRVWTFSSAVHQKDHAAFKTLRQKVFNSLRLSDLSKLQTG